MVGEEKRNDEMVGEDVCGVLIAAAMEKYGGLQREEIGRAVVAKTCCPQL